MKEGRNLRKDRREKINEIEITKRERNKKEMFPFVFFFFFFSPIFKLQEKNR